MSHAATLDQEQRERRVRLMIIIGLGAVVLLGGLAVSIVGSRWCVETKISALINTRTVFFMIDDDGQFIETADCRSELLATSKVRRHTWVNAAALHSGPML